MSPTRRFAVKNHTDQVAAKFLHQLIQQDPGLISSLDLQVEVVGRPKDVRPVHRGCPRCGH